MGNNSQTHYACLPCWARQTGPFPHLNPDETTSHSTKLPKDGNQVAGYLPEGEGANEALRAFHITGGEPYPRHLQ